ncbi:MAG: GspH/FimT family pseudopilin [Cellvibrionaceae bacterium]
MKKITGFTIIELMMTLMVIGVVLAIAVPSMSTLIKNNRQTSRVNELVSLINYSRSQAVGLNTEVTLCGSNDGATCNSANWETGGLIIKGIATSGTTPASTDILKIIEPQSSGSTLRRITSAATAPSSFDSSIIRFEKTGRMNGDDASSFTLCDDRGDTKAKGIVINGSGQARTAKDSDNDGVVEIIKNGALQAVGC